MDMKINSNIDPIARAMANQVKAAPPKAATDAATFEHTQGLEQALSDSPAVRPEVVARAQELIGDVSYPPEETIRQIAILIAANNGTPATGASSNPA
jgi:hypothetical protein